MYVIGQNKLRNDLLCLNKIPNLTIFLGPKGSGKTLISEWWAVNRNMRYVQIGNKINDMRELIENTVALSKPTIYYIMEADEMSIPAMNALLKIAEEPPVNCHICMGLTTQTNMLPTIISRGQVFTMNNYTEEQLKQWYTSQQYNVDDVDRLLECGNTPGNLTQLVNNDFEGIYKFVDKVYDNILQVSTGNSFKISKSIQFKEGSAGVPVDIFFDVMAHKIAHKIVYERENIEVNKDMLVFTNEARRLLQRKGANKPLIFDIWVLNIRTLREV